MYWARTCRGPRGVPRRRSRLQRRLQPPADTPPLVRSTTYAPNAPMTFSAGIKQHTNQLLHTGHTHNTYEGSVDRCSSSVSFICRTFCAASRQFYAVSKLTALFLLYTILGKLKTTPRSLQNTS